MPAGKDVPLKSRVTLTGLSKAELNGKKASICTRLNEGRYGVRVDGLESPIKLKPANLTATRRAQAACFLASHVASRRRLTQLRETIRCIKSQTQPAWLHLSWFSPDAELADAVKSMLASEGVSSESHHQQPQQLSQFEHYRFLAFHVKKLEERQSVWSTTWVLFSDDDDVWHPMRLQFYCLLLEQVGDKGREASQSMTCAWHAMRAAGTDNNLAAVTVRELALLESALAKRPEAVAEEADPITEVD